MERKTKVHVACSHTHMFTACLITRLSYQFTGRDMPLQKLSGWPFLCLYRNVGFSEYNPTQGNQLPKLGLRSTSSNAIIERTPDRRLRNFRNFVLLACRLEAHLPDAIGNCNDQSKLYLCVCPRQCFSYKSPSRLTLPDFKP